jgi:hypothetical protein
MLTILTVPKPFRGHVGEIQRNAIASWQALRPEIQIVLVGDEDGIEDAARGAGVEHVRGLAQNDRGTPRLDSAFECAGRVAEWPLWCFVNADILLLDDFPYAVERVASAFDEFLLVGESRDLDLAAQTRMSDAATRAQIRKRALAQGRLRGYAALDYFVFPKALFDPVPPFLMGRACFDNWLVWRARDQNRAVVDVTRSVVVVHQPHDYSHIPGGLDEAYYGEEARHNEQLAGGREHIYSLHDATHRLYSKGPPIPYPGSIFRVREKAREANVSLKILRDAHRPSEKALHPNRPLRLLGVFPEPTEETTPLLDTLADADTVDLDVLYETNAPAAAAGSTQQPRHVHWFPRSVRLAPLERALGRRYPITWTIWHSFYFLRPHCMLIWGWSTFATQAAIAWCTACRIPYLLLIDEHGGRVRGDGNEVVRGRLGNAFIRRAAGVVVTGAGSKKSPPTDSVDGERVGELPGSTEETANLLLEMVHSLREERLRNALEDSETISGLNVRAD